MPSALGLGCRDLNAMLQEARNPTGPAIQRYGRTFRVGDKVMQMRNDYDKDVFHGDIGRVAKTDEVEQEMTVRFDDRPVKYDFNELDELHLSYATTVHKSQGSECPISCFCALRPERHGRWPCCSRGRRDWLAAALFLS